MPISESALVSSRSSTITAEPPMPAAMDRPAAASAPADAQNASPASSSSAPPLAHRLDVFSYRPQTREIVPE